jgi:hypothetical protein
VLTRLRMAKNRSYLHIGVYVLVMSLIFALISATCTMPLSWRVDVSGSMSADCMMLDEHAQQHVGHGSEPAKDCSFKPCFASQAHPVLSVKNDQPEFMAVLLCFWLAGFLLARPQPRFIPRLVSPLPGGRRIPLIYRYCTLLN